MGWSLLSAAQDDVDMTAALDASSFTGVNGNGISNGATSAKPFEEDPLDEPITQEDAWQVINSYFAEKGLVRQQLGKLALLSSTALGKCSLLVRVLLAEELSC
jgi:hypothetical protein